MSIYKEILAQYWGYTSFRPLQEDIVEAVGSGKDTLALMPTGGGKSITFQVPALARDGLCLVITPLIALMKDQVEHLKSRKIKAIAVHSGMSRDEIDIALDNCIYGDYKFLYLSPERLTTDLFRIRVREMKVNLLAVDEAHCISQWGYDFRPSYLKIAELRDLLPDVPVLALTATATPPVARDIMEKLVFREPNILRKSYFRGNLYYVVRKTEDKPGEILKISRRIEGSAIIYVRNRKNTREIAEFLQQEGISADFYHAGLGFDKRMDLQENWQQGKVRIIVSTNAFGMGIDKPDVRFVIHMDLPDSPEAYFQEAGRAGRDEKEAWAILLYNASDERKVKRRIEVNFPGFDDMKDIYKALFNYLQVPVGEGKGMTHDFILGEFLSKNTFDALTVTNALNILSREGYFEITDELNNPSRIHFLADREDLYRVEVSNPGLDAFIKLLLRSYTGLFTQYVMIDEYILAQRSGLTEKKVFEFLVRLSELRIIAYIPKKKNPVITLLEERLDEKNIFISTEMYRFRKDRYLERINQMLEYAKTSKVCRSRYLLSYFGEKNEIDCGHCDVCRGRNITGTSKEADKTVIAAILKMLKNGPASLTEIARSFDGEENTAISILERIMEEGLVSRGPDMRFRLKQVDQ